MTESSTQHGHEPRRRLRRERPRIALNLTAMIDVTFLLLVYFLVATRFKLGEEIYRLDLPDRSAQEQQRDPFELDEQPLRIRVATTGPLPNAYSVRIEGPYDPPRSFDDLEHFLVERRITAGVSGGLFEPDHPLLIVPTATTTWQHAMQTFNAVARARYTNVTLGRPSG